MQDMSGFKTIITAFFAHNLIYLKPAKRSSIYLYTILWTIPLASVLINIVGFSWEGGICCDQ